MSLLKVTHLGGSRIEMKRQCLVTESGCSFPRLPPRGRRPASWAVDNPLLDSGPWEGLLFYRMWHMSGLDTQHLCYPTGGISPSGIYFLHLEG